MSINNLFTFGGILLIVELVMSWGHAQRKMTGHIETPLKKYSSHFAFSLVVMAFIIASDVRQNEEYQELKEAIDEVYEIDESLGDRLFSESLYFEPIFEYSKKQSSSNNDDEKQVSPSGLSNSSTQEARTFSLADLPLLYTVEESGEYTSQGIPILYNQLYVREVRSSAEYYPINRSTVFINVGYSREYKVIIVLFKETQDRYFYCDVDEDVFSDFLNADSMGEYYNEYIKYDYPCYKIEQ